MARRPDGGSRAVALVTGASRRRGIGAAIALSLARAGWNVATMGWRAYDQRMPWRSDPTDAAWLRDQIGAAGARTVAVDADLTLVETPARVFDTVEAALGEVTALVLAHTEGVDSDIMTTSVESFDRHFAVNARASWLLVREFARRFRGTPGRGRIVALTSDHVAGNLPYGASKAALDRIVLAAATEFGHDGRGITANVVNPGPTDTGWMTDEQLAEFARRNPQGRVGQPEDCASLVTFLCSIEGGWINGQLLRSDGGLR
jgi:3-oxoacyl-[acyl-carrier protein] reductase